MRFTILLLAFCAASALARPARILEEDWPSISRSGDGWLVQWLEPNGLDVCHGRTRSKRVVHFMEKGKHFLACRDAFVATFKGKGSAEWDGMVDATLEHYSRLSEKMEFERNED